MNLQRDAIYLFSCLLLVLVFSCNNKITNLSSSKDVVIYPPPPDTARIQYLTSISNSVQVEKKRSAFLRFILGNNVSLPIVKPYGISVKNEKIYVCDAGIDGIEIIDLKKSSFKYFVPKGKGQLKTPINCFADEKGFLFIADAGRSQVVIYDSLLKYVNVIGDTGSSRPTDVYVSDNKIWVTNSKTHRVNVYDNSYKLVTSFPESVPGNEDYLYTPTNLYVTENQVYISDLGDSKIKIFSKDGKFISAIGNYGSNIGQLVRPKGIAVDMQSNLYVVDAAFENVQIFNNEGKLLMFFGGSYKGPGDMWLPAKITIDYDNLKYFEPMVDPDYKLKYLIFVTNQYGPDKINVYGAVGTKGVLQK